MQKIIAMTSLRDLSAEIRALFEQKRMPDAAREAKRLIMACGGYTEEDFILRGDAIVPEALQEIIRAGTHQRLEGVPLSRIVGEREFWGLPFKVTADTLDPRPDTETLVEAVLQYVRAQKRQEHDWRILDLGTGTGCIPVALLHELPHAHAVAVDVNRGACMTAQENALRNNVDERFSVLNGSWTNAIVLSEFDIIVSNPPYIRHEEIRDLDTEVRNHDPVLALSGGESGLNCYEIIFSRLNSGMNKAARAFFEIGIGQGDDIARLVDDSNLRIERVYPDLAGIPRVVEICRGDK
jgi:release factor glutamine methyltransferase